MSRELRVVLVTGCPRSGTTPVGSNLALAAGARYLYEPFNPNYGLEAISRFYEVPGSASFPVERFDACVDAIGRLRLDLRRHDYHHDHGVRRIVKRLIGSRAHLSYRLCRLDPTLRTVIWKDPTACLSAQAAAERHGIPVLVTVRPALAVAASYKRMRWASSLESALDGLARVGIEYDDLVRRWGRFGDNHAIGGALLWYVINATLLRWAETTPGIHFHDLQDGIDAPVEVYRGLYGLLGLPWSERVATRLRRRYPPDDGVRTEAAALPQRAHVGRRSIGDVNTYGRRLLSDDEAAIVTEIAAPLWPRLQAACLDRATLLGLAEGAAKAAAAVGSSVARPLGAVGAGHPV